MTEANAISTVSENNFRLKISEVSKLSAVWSPEVKVYDVPWKAKIAKKAECLAVFLFCSKEDNTPNWSHVGFATFKLLPYSGDENGIEYRCDPYVFDASGLGFGNFTFIKWNDLFSPEKNYVKDDTINIDVKIESCPNEGSSSKLLFENTEKCCENHCTFRLTVTNVKTLMAVQSPKFKMRNLSWTLTVHKDSSHLGVRLQHRSDSIAISCESRMAVKLISSKNEVKPIEPVAQTNNFVYLGCSTQRIISWDELLKPENGFFNDNSIVIEVEIKASNPEGAVSNNEPKRLKFECAICFEVFSKQEVSSTQCGHLFCSPCIRNSIEAREKCPSCNADVTLESLHHVYLPIAN
ncbi:uncharacterized protein LOC129565945 isoform X1 [Sitodiplosis mosellana]|uniref:uncharacterized protein LOC129565945 isoform X1 n=1 Tax=Sitodiplosis mosellana TaxID=263140 RepID=UPI00244430AC|nr:uncharacterized protein LOC129565945 isoform X1 [Sitodiplosis mosellana]